MSSLEEARRRVKEERQQELRASANGTGSDGMHVPLGAQAAGDKYKRPFDLLKSYKINVASVEKIGTKLGVFDLHLEDGQVLSLGPATDVMSFRKTRAVLADANPPLVLPPMKDWEWTPVATALLELAEVIDVGSDQQAELHEWIAEYRAGASAAPVSSTDKGELIDALTVAGIAVDEVDRVYLSLPKFASALLALSPVRIARNDLIQRLHRDGFESVRMDYKPAGRETSAGQRKQCRSWVSPKGYFALITGEEDGSSSSSNTEGGEKCVREIAEELEERTD
jgi:hypothetical protein